MGYQYLIPFDGYQGNDGHRSKIITISTLNKKPFNTNEGFFYFNFIKDICIIRVVASSLQPVLLSMKENLLLQYVCALLQPAKDRKQDYVHWRL